jgi:hypothetical protein
MGDRVAVARLRGDAFAVEFVDVRVAYHTDGLFTEIDPRETQWAVLASTQAGLREGDRVIVSGLEDLVAGQGVAVDGPESAVGAAVPTGRMTPDAQGSARGSGDDR